MSVLVCVLVASACSNPAALDPGLGLCAATHAPPVGDEANREPAEWENVAGAVEEQVEADRAWRLDPSFADLEWASADPSTLHDPDEQIWFGSPKADADSALDRAGVTEVRVQVLPERSIHGCSINISALAEVPGPDPDLDFTISEPYQRLLDNGAPMPMADLYLDPDQAVAPDSHVLHLFFTDCYRHEDPDMILPMVIETDGAIEVAVFFGDYYQTRNAACYGVAHRLSVELTSAIGDRSLLGSSVPSLWAVRGQRYELVPPTPPQPGGGGSVSVPSTTAGFPPTTMYPTSTVPPATTA